MPITPVAGPVGSGKSQLVEESRRPGDVLIDFTAIYVALSGAVRGADGRYPERQDGDPLLPLASAVAAFALSEAVRRELNGFVTTASKDRVPTLERITGQPARILDPGDDAVIQRHYRAQKPSITIQCAKALGRWYGAKGGSTDDGRRYWASSSGRRYPIVSGGGGGGGRGDDER